VRRIDERLHRRHQRFEPGVDEAVVAVADQIARDERRQLGVGDLAEAAGAAADD
jgi:hypothetical protein